MKYDFSILNCELPNVIYGVLVSWTGNSVICQFNLQYFRIRLDVDVYLYTWNNCNSSCFTFSCFSIVLMIFVKRKNILYNMNIYIYIIVSCMYYTSQICRAGGELSTRDLQKMVQALPQYSEQIEKLSLHVDVSFMYSWLSLYNDFVWPFSHTKCFF